MIWLETLSDDWWHRYHSILPSTECVEELDIELLFLVRSLILEARTYARACKRMCLNGNDFQTVLAIRNIDQHRNPTSNKKHSNQENISLQSILSQADPISLECDRLQLTIHWLAIDGEQPIISENPLPSFIEENSPLKCQQQDFDKPIAESVDPGDFPLGKELTHLVNSMKRDNHEYQEHVHPITKNNLVMKPTHPRHSNPTNTILTPLTSPQACMAHELSVEQQLYFKLLTESCFNENEKEYATILNCLSSDAALQPLLPRLLLFISKGIQVNIHRHDINIVVRLLSILKALAQNRFISFDKYLHSIIPTLLTCLLCIFDTPKLDYLPQSTTNDFTMIWLMREEASDLISYFEHRYAHVPYFTARIISIIKSKTASTFSIVYACIRTLVLIDAQLYQPFIRETVQNFKDLNVLQSDFDLDHNEQENIFYQKLNILYERYSIPSKDTCNY